MESKFEAFFEEWFSAEKKSVDVRLEHNRVMKENVNLLLKELYESKLKCASLSKEVGRCKNDIAEMHSMALRKESQRQEYDRRQRAENRKKVVDLWQYIEKQTKKMGKPAKVLSCKLFETIYRYSKEEVLGAIDILFFSVSSKEIPADVQQAYSVIIKNVPINHATLRQKVFQSLDESFSACFGEKLLNVMFTKMVDMTWRLVTCSPPQIVTSEYEQYNTEYHDVMSGETPTGPHKLLYYSPLVFGNTYGMVIHKAKVLIEIDQGSTTTEKSTLILARDTESTQRKLIQILLSNVVSYNDFGKQIEISDEKLRSFKNPDTEESWKNLFKELQPTLKYVHKVLKDMNEDAAEEVLKLIQEGGNENMDLFKKESWLRSCPSDTLHYFLQCLKHSKHTEMTKVYMMVEDEKLPMETSSKITAQGLGYTEQKLAGEMAYYKECLMKEMKSTNLPLSDIIQIGEELQVSTVTEKHILMCMLEKGGHKVPSLRKYVAAVRKFKKYHKSPFPTLLKTIECTPIAKKDIKGTELMPIHTKFCPDLGIIRKALTTLFLNVEQQFEVYEVFHRGEDMTMFSVFQSVMCLKQIEVKRKGAVLSQIFKEFGLNIDNLLENSRSVLLPIYPGFQECERGYDICISSEISTIIVRIINHLKQKSLNPSQVQKILKKHGTDIHCKNHHNVTVFKLFHENSKPNHSSMAILGYMAKQLRTREHLRTAASKIKEILELMESLVFVAYEKTVNLMKLFSSTALKDEDHRRFRPSLSANFTTIHELIMAVPANWHLSQYFKSRKIEDLTIFDHFKEVIYSFNESSVKSNVTNTLSGGEAEDLAMTKYAMELYTSTGCMSQLLETITLSGDFLKEFGIHVKEETVNAHCALLQISKEDTKSFPRFIAEVSRLEDRKTRYKMDKVTEDFIESAMKCAFAAQLNKILLRAEDITHTFQITASTTCTATSVYIFIKEETRLWDQKMLSEIGNGISDDKQYVNILKEMLKELGLSLLFTGTSKPLNHIMLKDYNMKRIKSIVVEKLPEVTVTCEAVVLDFIGSDGTLKLQDLTKCLNVRSVSPKIPGDIKQHLAVLKDLVFDMQYENSLGEVHLPPDIARLIYSDLKDDLISHMPVKDMHCVLQSVINPNDFWTPRIMKSILSACNDGRRDIKNMEHLLEICEVILLTTSCSEKLSILLEKINLDENDISHLHTSFEQLKNFPLPVSALSVLQEVYSQSCLRLVSNEPLLDTELQTPNNDTVVLQMYKQQSLDKIRKGHSLLHSMKITDTSGDFLKDVHPRHPTEFPVAVHAERKETTIQNLKGTHLSSEMLHAIQCELSSSDQLPMQSKNVYDIIMEYCSKSPDYFVALGQILKIMKRYDEDLAHNIEKLSLGEILQVTVREQDSESIRTHETTNTACNLL